MRSLKTGGMQLTHVSEDNKENEYKRMEVGMAEHLSEDYEDFKFKSRLKNFILVGTLRSFNSRQGSDSLLHIIVRTMRTTNQTVGLRILI